jgi:transcriptional regulator with XRE-family HTH domain
MNQQVAGKRAKGSCVCGERLRELRTSCGLTQVELARLAGYSERLIRKAESGGSLSLATIADLAEALSSYHRWVSPAELCCSHEALARLFVNSYDEHERLMLDYCRHVLADDFVFHFAGEARSALAGEWLRAAGLQAWLDEFFAMVTRPVRRCLQVSYLTDENEVTARYSDALVAADQSCHTMWVNLHFTFCEGHIQRIVYQCDTSLVAKLAEYSYSTLCQVQSLVSPCTYPQPAHWASHHRPVSKPAS